MLNHGPHGQRPVVRHRPERQVNRPRECTVPKSSESGSTLCRDSWQPKQGRNRGYQIAAQPLPGQFWLRELDHETVNDRESGAWYLPDRLATERRQRAMRRLFHQNRPRIRPRGGRSEWVVVGSRIEPHR